MLKLIRGVTDTLQITITDDIGELYKLQSGDKLKLGIKRNWQDADYDVCKTATSDDLQGDGYIISFAPEDTINLIPSCCYYFDVGLQTADGDYFMIIPCSQCIIAPAVTQKEVT